MNTLFCLMVVLSLIDFLRRFGLLEVTREILRTFKAETRQEYYHGLERDYKREQIWDFSFSLVSRSSVENLASSQSIESFKSCFSDFQSQESFLTASDNEFFDSIGLYECEFFQPTDSVVEMIVNRNHDRLKDVSILSINNAMDDTFKLVQGIVKNYNRERLALEVKLTKYRNKKRSIRRVQDVEGKLEALFEQAKSALSYYDYILFVLFKHMYITIKRRFKSVTKQFDPNDDRDKFRILIRKISFCDELASFLGTSFSHYECDDRVFSTLQLCTFISEMFFEVNSKRNRAVEKHKSFVEECEAKKLLESSGEESTDADKPHSERKGGRISKLLSRVSKLSVSKKRRYK
ncbi:hypothetical protein OJ253_1687 [Cryptosporidium canis]|uniref:Uncharacterized protein n=1 Tax=Cryptosporidium canis TaxID=195482 RepID=A0A9D5DJI4_9CRYT|nr:hypothetical protein OJ253_1687 [Cryptosporidium canis]